MIIRYIITWFIVLSFLPNNAKLQEPANPKGIGSIQFKDLDRDGKDEVISAYKVSNQSSEVNILILKKTKERWQVADRLKTSGYAVDRIFFEDIDKDGKYEIIIGSKLCGQWNNLSIYKEGQKGYNKIYSNIYSKILMEDASGK